MNTMLWDSGERAIGRVLVDRMLFPCAFAPDGNVIACVNRDDNPIRIIDARNGEIIRNVSKMDIGKFEHAGHDESLAISPDGKTMAVSAPRGKIGLREIESGRLVGKFDAGLSRDDIAVFSPDGKKLAAGGLNQNILLWDVKSGDLQFQRHA
jgi:WD40 repeat protein